jgi:CRP-like cAMP-binding protein
MKYGWVKIFRGGNEGDEVILRMLGHNEFIGYVSLLKDTPYPDNAQALEYCELYFFPEMYSSHLYMRTMILPGQLFKCCVMR